MISLAWIEWTSKLRSTASLDVPSSQLQELTMPTVFRRAGQHRRVVLRRPERTKRDKGRNWINKMAFLRWWIRCFTENDGACRCKVATTREWGNESPRLPCFYSADRQINGRRARPRRRRPKSVWDSSTALTHSFSCGNWCATFPAFQYKCMRYEEHFKQQQFLKRNMCKNFEDDSAAYASTVLHIRTVIVFALYWLCDSHFEWNNTDGSELILLWMILENHFELELSAQCEEQFVDTIEFAVRYIAHNHRIVPPS